MDHTSPNCSSIDSDFPAFKAIIIDNSIRNVFVMQFLTSLFKRGCGSAGKESACDAGDPGSIPGSGRSPGEGIGYPLQYSWASLVVQLVKNLPAMRNTWVRSLGWEDPLEKGKATDSSTLAWRILWAV